MTQPSSWLHRGRRLRAGVLATVVLLVLLGAMATAIVLSQRQSKEHTLANFKLRGVVSATFVSTVLSEQAARERQAALHFLTGALVDHTIPYRPHEVLLVDGTGRLIAASPRTGARTLSAVDPHLARAATHAELGTVAGALVPTTFTAAAVPGTPWRLLIAVPDSKLYASISGAAGFVPWAVFALVALLGALLIALLARSLADRARLAELSKTLEKTARTDSLTGLFNRRALGEHLIRIAAHARRHSEPLSILMIDLDRFKQTNDNFGHEAGDRVLCAVADCLRDVLRSDDIYGRWGGDEFLVALPSTDERAAEKVASRIRGAARLIELEDIGLPDGVSLSVGAATAVHVAPGDLVHAADLALYRAKGVSREEIERGPVASSQLL